jgi:hypothetical protein
MSFIAARSPEEETRIPGCDAKNEQSRNALRSFRATFAVSIK